VFDGLKDKLSKFRNDVEETAEEKAEAEDVEETDSEAAASDSEAAASNAESASPDTQSTPEQESPTDTSSTDGTATAETTEQVDTTDSGASDSTESTETAEETDDEDESSGPGRLKRAAAFATGKIIIEEEDLEDPLWELEMALLESDVEMSVAEEILETVREKMIGETRKQVDTTAELVELALHDALVDVISVGQFDFEKRLAEADKPVTIVFTGVNGVGKTTSIAKLSEYLADRGYSSVLANGDTYRAGANEQLQKHADNLDRKLISHEQGGDPAAVIYDGVEYAEAHDIDVVLGDTAG